VTKLHDINWSECANLGQHIDCSAVNGRQNVSFIIGKFPYKYIKTLCK
jgi:hypothetical protein